MHVLIDEQQYRATYIYCLRVFCLDSCVCTWLFFIATQNCFDFVEKKNARNKKNLASTGNLASTTPILLSTNN